VSSHGQRALYAKVVYQAGVPCGRLVWEGSVWAERRRHQLSSSVNGAACCLRQEDSTGRFMGPAGRFTSSISAGLTLFINGAAACSALEKSRDWFWCIQLLSLK
jgi:hypothetical protein